MVSLKPVVLHSRGFDYALQLLAMFFFSMTDNSGIHPTSVVSLDQSFIEPSSLIILDIVLSIIDCRSNVSLGGHV